jgi:outer membrane protein assembly factor BamB
MTRRVFFVAAAAAVVALGACSSSDKPKPTPLEPVAQQLLARIVWTQRLGTTPLPLAAVARGGQFVVAAGDGTVAAYRAADGTPVWSGSAGAPVVAGVGSDGRFAAVVTRDNELVVFDQGAVKWRQRLPSRVSTAPLVAGERVFVMGVDRVVQAFDVLDGRRLWRLARPGDALTLAQPGVLAAYKDTLLAGQGARLAAIDPLRGSVRWELPLAAPRGTNEIERLADLVGPALRVGERVCARAFQAAVACADVERASLLWSKTVGGTNPVGGDDSLIVGADANDRITAWRPGSGEVAWTSERLLHRDLSGAVLWGRAVVFGDYEGQLHFLDRETGNPLARLATDGSPVLATPVVEGRTLLVTTRAGGVYAIRE